MTPTDPRLRTALDAATDRIRSTLVAVVRQLGERLAALAQSSTRIAERDALNTAQFELRRNAATLHRDFERALIDRIAQDLAPPPVAKKTHASVDWQSLSLVDDREVEDRMSADRIGQQITQGAEEALRELDAHIGALLPPLAAGGDRNPLRGEVLGAALHAGINGVSKEPEVRRLLTRELGAALAKAMPACYAAILDDLRRRGVQPLELSVRQLDGPGYQLPGLNSGYETVDSVRGAAQAAAEPVPSSTPVAAGGPMPFPYGGGPSYLDRMPPTDRSNRAGRPFERTLRGESGRGGAYLPSSGRPGASSTLRDGAWRTDGPGSAGGALRESAASRRGGEGYGTIRSDAELMTLLRQLNAVGMGLPGHDAGASDRADGFDGSPRGVGSRRASGVGEFGDRYATDGAAPASNRGGMSGLMAVNLIRAHREELVRAAGGQLDHMVIDVVGSLFDQILSDTRVPPQMARQIARLQLPVLRVALGDPTFFSSRRHPVRRFVNRIASLACAFDDFDEGPGQHFLGRVTALVDEIVDGDFDQIELYAAKLEALERQVEEDATADVQRHGAATTLGAKETELRLQQRYVLQLQAALKPLGLADWLEAFLAQVWSQALLLAVTRDGAEGERAKRYRRVARDIVTSVQPQGLPMLRKRFLMLLPPLFKDLDEGLALIGWPADAQTAFLGRLRAAQAQSLKVAPRSELDHNLYAKQIEQVFAAPLPGQEALAPTDPVPEVAPETLAKRFTREEAQRIGLVSETAVDWSETLAVDPPGSAPGSAGGGVGPNAAADGSAFEHAGGVDIDLGAAAAPAGDTPPSAAADGREPTRGPGLMEHVRLGFAYQMHLKDGWQKVRLAHVSPGRGFFVFTGGRRHQETISMTARMLARMCETQRFRAVETDYLVDRASQRARKQLASMRASMPPRGPAATSRTANPGP